MIKIIIELFLEFFKIGLFTFGGGYAMIPLVKEVVDYGWISEEQFSNMVGLSEVTPGPIALNMATFVGATRAGFFGGMFATIGVVLPSFIIICIVASLLSHFSDNKYVKSSLKGTMFVAIGLLISVSIIMSLQTLTTFGQNVSFEIDRSIIKVFVAVLTEYLFMWLTLRKKPGPIPTIFMSLLVGLMVNLGWLPSLVTFIALKFLYLVIAKKN